jgi:hypothetical protein
MNRKANLSLVASAVPLIVFLGLVSGELNPSTIWLLALLCPFLAIYLGHWALYQQKKMSLERGCRARAKAIAGATFGYIEIALIVLVFATSHEHGNRAAANEANAVSHLRTLSYTASEYAETHPNEGFPDRIAKLAVPIDGTGRKWTIDAAMAKGERVGYRFQYEADAPDASGKIQHYKITADPIIEGETGVRHFYMDETRTIRWATAKPADVKSTPL